jgi:diaminohydroxyphosphoribosylaminopyrimidine deaminase/5-amino-6-(5-phosphoribosylamino)uracil reductase
MLRAALAAARRGDGRVFPNPSVGAVIYRGDRILGRGTTQPPGGRHAEIVAIESVRRRHGERALRGASIATTLEPCSFTGRTGPCADALVAAGLGRVVSGCQDPHPKVGGRGYRTLRAAGIEVVTGLLEAECRYQHRGFLSAIERGRPWVTLKLATTLDGRIATARGESRWITGPESRAFVHRLRDASDGVMVGSATALADDPRLDVRRGTKHLRTPVRVLLDGRLRVPLESKLLSDRDADRTWVLCRERARGIRGIREAAGRVLPVRRSPEGRVDLARAMKTLAKEGLTTVLVEGGGGLAAALLRARLVDEVHWMLAPKLIGGDGRPGLGPLALRRLKDAVALSPERVSRRGEDLHVHALLEEGRRALEGKGRRG